MLCTLCIGQCAQRLAITTVKNLVRGVKSNAAAAQCWHRGSANVKIRAARVVVAPVFKLLRDAYTETRIAP